MPPAIIETKTERNEDNRVAKDGGIYIANRWHALRLLLRRVSQALTATGRER